MKKMKFIIAFVLMLICMLFIGESFQDVLGSFTSSYAYTSIEKSEEQSEAKMIADLLSEAKKSDVKFFAVNKARSGMNNTHLTVYYSDTAVLKDLEKRFNIKERSYASLFLGDTKISFVPFGEIQNTNDIEQLQLIGTDEGFSKFERSIHHYTGVDSHAGSAAPALGDSVVPIWIIAGLAIFSLTFYELLLSKKETYIKISFGERTIHIILKNILYDTAVMSLLFYLAFLVASQITYCRYLIGKSILVFGIIIVLNACIYFSIYLGDVKTAFSCVGLSNKFLVLNYGVKIVTMVLSVCIVSGNIALIAQGISFLKQKQFYKQYEGYSFMMTLEKPDERYALPEGKSSQKLNYAFYKDCVENDSVIAQSALGGETNAIYINRGNQNYLKENIKSLRRKNFSENKLYFIVPENVPEREEQLSLVKMFVEMFFQTGSLREDLFEVITYSENISLLAIDNNPDSLNSYYMNNPIVFFENVEAGALDDFYGKTGEEFNRYGLERNLMFDVSKEDLLSFAEAHGYNSEKLYFNSADVIASYMEQVNKTNQMIYLNAVLCLIVLLFEFMIIALIIKMQYTVNSVELTIKRVFGYSLPARNKTILLLTILTSVAAACIALTVNFFADLTQPVNILIGALIIPVLEMPVIVYNIRKLEKASIQKLLKGGML